MENRYYFDTSIWLDIFEKRGNNGEYAKRLMRKIIQEDSVVVYSDMIVMELSNLGYSTVDIKKILSVAKPDHILRIQVNKTQFQEGKKVSRSRKISQGDAIHAIVARDAEACLVSRDEDFQKLKDVARVFSPESLC